ncbi:MAG: hypothetical protein HY335_10615, partial [Deinococcus sp.]|nr:hypothetical protein [Deinococcus sp.]
MSSRVGVIVLIVLLVASLVGNYLLYQQASTARGERDAAQRQASQAQAQMNQLNTQVAELEGRISAVRAERDTLQTERDTLQAERDQAEQQLQALQQVGDSGTIPVAGGDVAQVQQNVQAALGNLNASTTDLRGALQAALDAIQSLRAALATRPTSGDAQALEARVAELQAEVDLLQRAVGRDANAARLAQLEQERDAAQAQVVQLSSQLQEMQQQLTDLQADLGERQDEIERLQTALNEAQARIDAATA